MRPGRILWEPDEKRKRSANITKFSDWLTRRGRHFGGYGEMWEWSTTDIGGFWTSVWEYFDVVSEGGRGLALGKREMPGADWFPGARLNFARHVFRQRRGGEGVVAINEEGSRVGVSWRKLEEQTGALARHLKETGVVKGDTVAAYLPNSAEAVVGFLACASIGAVWTACSPDFGAQAVLDRLTQADPKVLLTVDRYRYGGRTYDRGEEVRKVAGALRGLREVVTIGAPADVPSGRGTEWEDAVSGNHRLEFEEVPFSHPLWVVYSSGTTGLPKPIVHGHGGILLEHLKELSFHNDLRDGDRFFWFTTTGWMMWNYLVGGLLHGATAVLFDGSPGFPSMTRLWDMAESERLTFLGVSAAYISACMKSRTSPGTTHRLRELRGVGSTGSPLTSDGFEWVYGNVKEDLWLASLSGGTDVCTAFVGGNPTLPVRSGELQCRSLGAKVEAFDEWGRPVVEQMGELVVTEPMPSMPLFLLGDPDGLRYRESYFEKFPGVWRHGDWITITDRGTCVIFGRSDATIKRSGVRIGTSEIYRSVESIPEVADSLAIDAEAGDRGEMLLFVVTRKGADLDQGLIDRIKSKIREDLSPRYVPDRVVAIPSVPRTLSGKKLEVPVKRVFMGEDPSKAFNRESLQNPDAVDFLVSLARQMRGAKT
ncbi:MAG: acetoacetate--CoA ligase [Thaumarchaeota archaeon]|nr:acetoacetate--CoA ligase [Nitrososphaerota archaeon]